MTSHPHTNPTLGDVEKDEQNELQELNTAQIAKVYTDAGVARGRAHAARLIEHNRKNGLGRQ